MAGSAEAETPATPEFPGADSDRRAGAFFDLDKTLMAGSSGMHFGRAAFRSGLVGRRQLLIWGAEQLRFRLRGTTDERAVRLLEEVKELLAGVPERDIERMVPQLLAGVLPRIYPQMLDEVHAHQDAGRPTFIVSAAGDGLVALLGDVLGMDGGIGTRYAVDDDGLLTGELDGPFMYGEGKVEAVRRFAAEHDIYLEASWAYSDSVSDLPMLRAVGIPVAVNPDEELARVAREEGWRVMRFERLGRRLAIAGATLTAAALGGLGSAIASRRRSSRGAVAAIRRR
jgi:HAD superfamily hydrolase (TIGR01490 family)